MLNSAQKGIMTLLSGILVSTYETLLKPLGLPSLRAAEPSFTEYPVINTTTADAGSADATVVATTLLVLSAEEKMSLTTLNQNFTRLAGLDASVFTGACSKTTEYIFSTIKSLMGLFSADVKDVMMSRTHGAAGLKLSLDLAGKLYKSLFNPSRVVDEKYRLAQGTMVKLALMILERHLDCDDEAFWLSDYGTSDGEKISVRAVFLKAYQFYLGSYNKLAQDYGFNPHAFYGDFSIALEHSEDKTGIDKLFALLAKNRLPELFSELKAQNTRTRTNLLQAEAHNTANKSNNLRNLSLLCSLLYLGKGEAVLSFLRLQDTNLKTLGHILAEKQDLQVIQRYLRLLSLLIDQGHGPAVYSLLVMRDNMDNMFEDNLLKSSMQKFTVYLSFVFRLPIRLQLEIFSLKNARGLNLWETFHAKYGLPALLNIVDEILSDAANLAFSFTLLSNSSFKRSFLEHINGLSAHEALQWLGRKDSQSCTVFHCITPIKDNESTQDYLATLSRLSLNGHSKEIVNILKIQNNSMETIGHKIVNNSSRETISSFINLLRILSEHGHESDVDFILNTLDSEGKSLNSYLAEHPHKAVHSAYLLLSHPLLKAIQSTSDEAALIACIDRYKAEPELIQRAFLLAATLGRTELCVLLKSVYGADINGCDHEANTALHLAFLNEHLATADQLILLKADLNLRNNAGQDAASYAPHALRASYRKEKVSFTPVEHPLVTVITAGADATTIRTILENAKPELAIKNQALLLSAKLGAKENCSLLVKHGAEIDASDADGNTALHLALKAGKVEVASLLRTLKANLFIRNSEGLDAASYAPAELQELFRTIPSETPSIEPTPVVATTTPELRPDLEEKTYEKSLKQSFFAAKALLAKLSYAMTTTELIAHYDEVLPFMRKIRELNPPATPELIQIKTLFGVLKAQADLARVEAAEATATALASAATVAAAQAAVAAKREKEKAAAKAGVEVGRARAAAAAARAGAGAGAGSGKAGAASASYCGSSLFPSDSTKATFASASARADDITHTLRFTAMGIGGHLDELPHKLGGGSGEAKAVDIHPSVAKAGLLYEVFRLFALFEQRDGAHYLIRRIRNHLCHQYNDHFNHDKNPEALFKLASYLRTDQAIADLCEYSEKLRGSAKADFDREPLKAYFESLGINPEDRFLDTRKAEDILPSVQFALSILAEFNRRLDPMLNKTAETIALGSPVLLAACKMAIMILNDALNDFENKGEQCRLLRNELVSTKCISEIELNAVLVAISRLRNRAGHTGGTLSMRAGFVIATDDDMNPMSISRLASKLEPLCKHYYDERMRSEAASAASGALACAASK